MSGHIPVLLYGLRCLFAFMSGWKASEEVTQVVAILHGVDHQAVAVLHVDFVSQLPGSGDTDVLPCLSLTDVQSFNIPVIETCDLGAC